MNQEAKDNTNTGDYPDALLVKHHRFSIIWVVPLIALAVAGWLIYDTYSNRGVDITITFEDGSGLVAGKTLIEYRGVQVGTVQHVRLSENLSDVVVHARLDNSASGLAKEGSEFWVVRPEIGLTGVRGLDTLLSGNYIGLYPGTGKLQRDFKGLSAPPAAGPGQPGLSLILQAPKLASLQIGSPVYYREFKVGQVDQVSLASDARSVHVHIHIKEGYHNLIRENTRFWNASGIGMDLGLLGVKVKTESLESLLTGGIAFATPPNDSMGGTVTDNTVFQLYDSPKDEWLDWSPTLEVPDTTLASTPPSAPAPSGTPASSSSDPDNATVEQPDGTGSVGDAPPASAIPHGPPSHHH